MIESYKKFINNYINFKDCTSRKEYWLVVLCNIIISITIGLLQEITEIEQFATLEIIFSLATIVPNISLMVRRLHDINKSGWYYFITFIPIVGPLLMLVYLCTDRVEPNQYGNQI